MLTMTANSTTPAKPLSQMTRDELYAHVRSQGKDLIVLREMQRLGYWPQSTDIPAPEEALLEREKFLTQRLLDMQSELAKISDPEKALRLLQRERMDAARERREQTRREKIKQRYEKARAFWQRRQTGIDYIGEDLSAGLVQQQGNVQRLQQYGLPEFHDAAGLALFLNISLPELRFLSFQRKVSRYSHYQYFSLKKKTGGLREIAAPMPRIKRVQYRILDGLLQKVPVHDAAHGFVGGKSVLSNAIPHTGQAIVINLDVKDFFPSVGWRRVKGIFRQLGYSEQAATLLSMLCTELPVSPVKIDGQQWLVARADRRLPQGAPTSPALTNLLCFGMDKRLQQLAQRLGFRYTRYADDLTFSAADPKAPVGKLLWRVSKLMTAEGLTLHPDKQRVMRAHQRQEVTGIVVNQHPSLNRDTLHRFRSLLNKLEKQGPAGLHWNGNTDVLRAAEGFARYLMMVQPSKGAVALQRVHRLKKQWSGAPAYSGSNVWRKTAADGGVPLRKNGAQWWKASTTPAPVQEKTDLQRREQRMQEKHAQLASDASNDAALPENRQAAPVNHTTQNAGANQSVSKLPPMISAGTMIVDLIAGLTLSILMGVATPLLLTLLSFYATFRFRRNFRPLLLGVLILLLILHVLK